MKVRHIYLFSLLIFCFILAIASAYAQSAGSPLIYEVKFTNGIFVKTGTVLPSHPCSPNGPTECGNGNYTNLMLKVAKGARVRITLTSATGGAVFTISNAARDPLEKGSAVTSWIGTFEADEEFPITVYTFKSFTRYKLKITKLN